MATRLPERGGNPFAALEALREQLPRGKSPRTQPAPAPRGPARAVLRLERKGRGGKEVTVVEKLDLGVAELSQWAHDLKTALGVGGSVDGAAIVLAGDCRSRVEAVLKEKGVGRVIRG